MQYIYQSPAHIHLSFVLSFCHTSVQGYLRVSVQIVGPGDKLYVHNEAEDKRKEKEAEKDAGGGIAGMVIMPPAIKREGGSSTQSRRKHLSGNSQCVAKGLHSINQWGVGLSRVMAHSSSFPRCSPFPIRYSFFLNCG